MQLGTNADLFTNDDERANIFFDVEEYWEQLLRSTLPRQNI